MCFRFDRTSVTRAGQCYLGGAVGSTRVAAELRTASKTGKNQARCLLACL
jgi:hypothetical protein